MRLLNELTSITLYRTSLPHRRCYSFPPPPPRPTPTTAAAVDPSTTVVTTTLPHPSNSLPSHRLRTRYPSAPSNTLTHPPNLPMYSTAASISAVRPYRRRCHGDRYCCTHQYSFLPPPREASPTTTTTTTPRRGPSPTSPPSTVHRQTVTPTTRRRHRRPFFY